MDSPTDLVRRFCAGWSDNIGTAELAAFITDDAVYHDIPLAPVIGKKAIVDTIDSFIRPGRQASKPSTSASSTSPPTDRS